MNSYRHTVVSAILASAALAFLSCSSDPGSPSTPTPPIAPAPTVVSVVVTGSGCVAGAADGVWKSICSVVDDAGAFQLTAIAQLSDAATQDVTKQSVWSSTNTAVATVTGDGLVSVVSGGEADIIATYQGRSGGQTLRVSSVTGFAVTGPACTPASAQEEAANFVCPPAQLGGTIQLTATLYFSNGSTQNVTTTAQWSSSNAFVATVTPSGLVTLANVGAADIVAVYRGRTARQNVRVQVPAAYEYRVYPEEFQASPWGQTFIVGVATNRDDARWRVTTDVGWIQLLTTSGVGDGSLRYRVLLYDAGPKRVGHVLVSGLSGNYPPAIHTVHQAAIDRP